MLHSLKNKVINFSGQASAFLLVPMVIIAIVQVGSRYLTSDPVTFTEELLRFLLIWSAILGSVYCFGTGRHLALSFLATIVSPKIKVGLEVFVNLLILIFCLLILVFGGVKIVLATTEQLSATMRIPMAWVYSILPFSGVMISIIIGIDTIEKIQTALQIQQGDK